MLSSCWSWHNICSMNVLKLKDVITERNQGVGWLVKKIYLLSLLYFHFIGYLTISMVAEVWFHSRQLNNLNTFQRVLKTLLLAFVSVLIDVFLTCPYRAWATMSNGRRQFATHLLIGIHGREVSFHLCLRKSSSWLRHRWSTRETVVCCKMC